jgi:hypothetical protein
MTTTATAIARSARIVELSSFSFLALEPAIRLAYIGPCAKLGRE